MEERLVGLTGYIFTNDNAGIVYKTAWHVPQLLSLGRFLLGFLLFLHFAPVVYVRACWCWIVTTAMSTKYNHV